MKNHLSDIIKMIGITALGALFVIILWGCGGGSGSEDYGTPNPATGYCTSGAVALQLAAGDIEKARPIFLDLIARGAQPADSADHVLSLLDINPETHQRHWSDDAKRAMDDGWQVAVRIQTEFGHYLYVAAMYPTEETGDRWHLECIETSKHNFGQRRGVDIMLVEKKYETGAVVEVELVDGGFYDGVEVGSYFILKP